MLEIYEKLFRAAGKAREMAYAPYSRFAVGAALLAADGSIWVGCNVENVSYPVGLCAEHNALGQAVAAGKRAFSAVAVCAGENPVTPCGICRQALAEFGDMDVVYPDKDGALTVVRLSELLPHAFDRTENPSIQGR